MSAKKKHIAIIGGGITGLAAAFYLHKDIEMKHLPLRFTLIEAESRLGGKIQTETHDGYVMEKGPDSFLARKKSASELVHDLGMQDELVRNHTGQSYILHRGRLHPIPAGAVMGIPTEWRPFVRSRLFSFPGKARAACDLILPRSEMKEDQAVGHFFRRRLGNEVVDHLIEPLLSGIYAGNLDDLSLMSTFPQFYEMERKHRSLIRAIRQSRRDRTAGTDSKPKGQFLTLKRGLQSLVDAIERRLPPTAVWKSTALRQIEKRSQSYRLHLSGGRSLDADAVLLTVPSRIAHEALNADPVLHGLHKTKATSVANVILAYPESAVSLRHEGTGFVVPRREPYTITACTWTHKKWPHTAPSGKTLFRCYVGRAGDDTIVDQSDDVILQAALHDLRRIPGIIADAGAPPEFYRVTRWKNAMPQYPVGHRTQIKKVKEHMREHWPGVMLAGASYEGVGLPDCITQGKEAVEEILESVMSRS